MAEGGNEAVRADGEALVRAKVLALQNRERELERVLGRKKTLENKILREAGRRGTGRVPISAHDLRLPPDRGSVEPGSASRSPSSHR